MKRSLIRLIILLSTLFLTTNVASASAQNDDNENNQAHLEYFLEISDMDEIEVINSFDNEIEHEISESVKEKLAQEKFDDVADLLATHHLSLQYVQENQPSQTMSVGSAVKRTYYQYHTKRDITGRYLRSWTTALHVQYRENANGTYTVVSNPTMTLNTTFGPEFVIMPSAISTGYTYVNGKKGVNFHTRYRMRAMPIKPISVAGKIFDWGTVNFTVKLR